MAPFAIGGRLPDGTSCAIVLGDGEPPIAATDVRRCDLDAERAQMRGTGEPSWPVILCDAGHLVLDAWPDGIGVWQTANWPKALSLHEKQVQEAGGVESPEQSAFDVAGVLLEDVADSRREEGSDDIADAAEQAFLRLRKRKAKR